jgi:hypothetical protein
MIQAIPAPRKQNDRSAYIMPQTYGGAFLTRFYSLITVPQRQFADMQASGSQYQYYVETTLPTMGVRLIAQSDSCV